MSIPLFDRFDKGDSQLTEEGEYVYRKSAAAIRDLVSFFEEDVGASIDLRDLKSILHEVTSEVLLNQIICRRLAPDDMKPEDKPPAQSLATAHYEDYLSFYEPDLEELPGQGWPPSTYDE